MFQCEILLMYENRIEGPIILNMTECLLEFYSSFEIADSLLKSENIKIAERSSSLR